MDHLSLLASEAPFHIESLKQAHTSESVPHEGGGKESRGGLLPSSPTLLLPLLLSASLPGSRAFLLPSCSLPHSETSRGHGLRPTVTLSGCGNQEAKAGPSQWPPLKQCTVLIATRSVAFGFVRRAFVKGNLRFRVLFTHFSLWSPGLCLLSKVSPALC